MIFENKSLKKNHVNLSILHVKKGIIFGACGKNLKFVLMFVNRVIKYLSP